MFQKAGNTCNAGWKPGFRNHLLLLFTVQVYKYTGEELSLLCPKKGLRSCEVKALLAHNFCPLGKESKGRAVARSLIVPGCSHQGRDLGTPGVYPTGRRAAPAPGRGCGDY